MCETTVRCESTFPVVNFMKSKYRSSVSDKNLVPELRYRVLNRQEKIM